MGLVSVSEWGFILLCFVVTEILTWIVCVDLPLRDKITLPIGMTTVIIFLMIAFKMMGVQE